MENDNGGYVFISHSHLDIDEVRQLRNGLEEAGFEPLCFFLKCLDDGCEDELDDLIKREIDAREWFIYARTENSKVSNWVFKECKYRLENRGFDIENLNDDQIKEIIKGTDQIQVIDLKKMSIDDWLEKLVRGLRVNLISSHKDYVFVNRLRNKLKENDLQVTWDADLVYGKDYDVQVVENIKKASEAGTNIIILSKNSMNSEIVEKEVQVALHYDSLIMPVFIDDVQLDGPFLLYFGNIQSIFTNKPIKDENDLDEFIDYVVDEIRTALNDKF